MSNCTPTYKAVDTSQATYKKASVSLNSTEGNHIALLPTLANKDLEAFRRATGYKLYKAFCEKYGVVKIISPEESMNLINQASLSNQYADMLTVYEKSGILTKATLEKLGLALDSKYLVFSSINDQFDGGSLVKSTTGRRAYSIYLQTWDIQKGDIIWEGFGSAEAYIDGTSESDWFNLMELASKGGVERFDLDPFKQPPIKNLYKENSIDMSSATGFLIAAIGAGTVIALVALLGL